MRDTGGDASASWRVAWDNENAAEAFWERGARLRRRLGGAGALERGVGLGNV